MLSGGSLSLNIICVIKQCRVFQTIPNLLYSNNVSYFNPVRGKHKHMLWRSSASATSEYSTVSSIDLVNGASPEVKVTSREMIKPSSPTPPHAKTVQLSFIDQMAPAVYAPFVYFYKSNPSHDALITKSRQSLLLKRSLSDILVRFQPLAGRVQGNASIDCNDEGAEFYEANVSGDLSQVIENPTPEILKGLLPFEPMAHDRNVVLGVQVNHFSCGGMAIGVCISHKLVDAKAHIDFVNAWAAMARGDIDEGHENVLAYPKFDGASYFPPIDWRGYDGNICKEKIVTRRFIFDKKMLDTLKEGGGGQVTRPTRAEVVSAFIWKRVMEAAQGTSSDLTKISHALFAVNLRPRMEPPIPRASFANFWGFTTTSPFTGGESRDHPTLVRKLREAVRKIDANYVKTLQNGFETLIKMDNESKIGIEESCRFTVTSAFPVYEADFSWGKPTRVYPVTMPFKNLGVLISTECGKGIEAWMNISQEDISIIDRDPELLSLAAPVAKNIAAK